MDLNRLTEQSQEALGHAQDLTVRRNHQVISALHLMAVLLAETDGLPSGGIVLQAAERFFGALRQRSGERIGFRKC